MAFIFIGQGGRTPSKLGYKTDSKLQIYPNPDYTEPDTKLGYKMDSKLQIYPNPNYTGPDRSDRSIRPVRPVGLR